MTTNRNKKKKKNVLLKNSILSITPSKKVRKINIIDSSNGLPRYKDIK